MADAKDWLDAISLPDVPREPSAPAAPGDGSYGARALEIEADGVRNLAADSHVRNRTLNAAAFSLGQLVAGGVLAEDTVRHRLTEAARACGLGDRETQQTITSGLRAGARDPRGVPEPRAQFVGAREAYARASQGSDDDLDGFFDNESDPGPDPLAGEAGGPAGEPPARFRQAGKVEDPHGRPGEHEAQTIERVITGWRADGALRHEPTGIDELDEFTGGGPVYGTRWYLAGAPDAGKTALLIQIAHVYLERGVTVGLLAIDEEPDDVVTRLAQRAGWSRQHCEVRDPIVLEDISTTLACLPLRMYGSEWSIEAAGADLAAFARARDPEAVWPRAMLGVDSLQTVQCAAECMVGARDMPLRQAIAARTQAIRQQATQHHLIALTTSEMNRASYSVDPKTGNATAEMMTAAESRAVEYSARVLLTLRASEHQEDVVELRIAKNKHGRAGAKIFLELDRRAQVLVSRAAPDDQPSHEEAVQGQQDSRRRERTAMDAATACVYLAANQGATATDLRAQLRVRIGCGTERVTDALAALGDAIRRVQYGRNAQVFLDGTKIDVAILDLIPGDELQRVCDARHP